MLRVSDVDRVDLDDKGAVKDADKLTKSIKSEWSDFIQTTTTQGAQTAAPPVNSGGSAMTKADIYKKDDHGRYTCLRQSVKRRSWKTNYMKGLN